MIGQELTPTEQRQAARIEGAVAAYELAVLACVDAAGDEQQAAAQRQLNAALVELHAAFGRNVERLAKTITEQVIRRRKFAA